MGLEAVHKFLSAELQVLYIQSFEVCLITVYCLTADCCLRDKHWRGASNPPGVSSPTSLWMLSQIVFLLSYLRTFRLLCKFHLTGSIWEDDKPLSVVDWLCCPESLIVWSCQCIRCVMFTQQLALFAPQAVSVHLHVQTLRTSLSSRQVFGF